MDKNIIEEKIEEKIEENITLDLVKKLFKAETSKSKISISYRDLNYTLLTAYITKFKNTEFKVDADNTNAKNLVIKDFADGGYNLKNNENEVSKLTQAKINRYSRIYSHNKIQDLIKKCENITQVSKILVDNKLTTQGKLFKYITPPKTIDYKKLAEQAFENLIEHDQDETQEFILWSNSKAKLIGCKMTQAELDADDKKNQEKTVNK